MKNITIWAITPKTNLHVGNENTSSYGLIDLAIQRNVTTTLPCINSSSLKGAIKEYLLSGIPNVETPKVKEAFGSDKTNQETHKGNFTFFDADLIAIPEANNNDPKGYKLAVCKDSIHSFAEKAKMMGAAGTVEEIENAINKIVPEGNVKEMNSFITLCNDDNLPIIARNALKEGKSENLWYEQVLPAESILLTLIDTGNSSDALIKDGDIIQVGANATIGYGFCQFKKIK